MKKYRAGLIGAGETAQLHLESYRHHPDRVEVMAIYDENPELLKRKADKYGIPDRFKDLESFVAQAQVDVVVVCTPAYTRKEVVLPLLEAGFPLFIESPFSEHLQEAIEMTKKARERGVPVSINQNFRWHFPFEKVRELLAEEVIGKVTAVHLQNLELRQEEDEGWKTEDERYALSVMGVHWMDGIRRILGVDPKSVVSLLTSSETIKCKGETDTSVHLEFVDGTIATYNQSFSSPFQKTEMIVIGEIGVLVCDYHSVKLFRDRSREEIHRWRNLVSKEMATFNGLDQLLVSLETGEEAPNSALDNVKTIAMLDAAYRSAEEKQIMTLPEGVTEIGR